MDCGRSSNTKLTLSPSYENGEQYEPIKNAKKTNLGAKSCLPLPADKPDIWVRLYLEAKVQGFVCHRWLAFHVPRSHVLNDQLHGQRLAKRDRREVSIRSVTQKV